MTEHETPPEAAPAKGGEDATERQTTPFLVMQFFIFPMAIVAVCVAVFAVFGLIASEGKGLREQLAEVRSGGGMFNVKRWQAAYSLANALESQRDKARSDPRFVAELLALHDESKSWDDPLVRRYLTLALGRLGDARAVAALRGVLQEGDGTRDPETRVYAAWALGAIADPGGLPELLALAKHDDAGLRKTAAHALGAFRDEASGAALRAAVEDGAEDVRWNAAVALARRGDASGAPVLRQMLDREHLASVHWKDAEGKDVQGLPQDQADAAVEQAVAAAAVLHDPSLRAALEKVRDADPNLKLRDAARRALAPPQAN